MALDTVRIEAEAAAWVARLDYEGATEGDRAAFQAWCKLSDLHLKAVERLTSLWSDMDGFHDVVSQNPCNLAVSERARASPGST